MSVLSWIRSWFAPSRPRQRYGKIVAGASGPPVSVVNSLDSSTDWNVEVLEARDRARGRTVPAYYNNPVYRGLIRNRRSRTLGAEFRFRAAVPADEIPGIGAEQAKTLNRAITRLYRRWAESGECDATGRDRRIGALQGQAFIDAMGARGGVLVRAVNRPQNPTCPLAIELISVTRMKRPPGGSMDLINEAGIQYSDAEHRTVTGYWVEVVTGFGRSMRYEFVPASEASLFEPEELVGVEAALPRDVSTVKSLHRLGQFQDALLDATIALAKQPITITPPVGADATAWSEAYADDAEPEAAVPLVRDIDGIEAHILDPGAVATRHRIELPAPDLPGFVATQLRAVAAGADISYSRVSKVPDGSYAAGRMMEQDDRPQIEIDREVFVSAFGAFVWRRFVECLWAFEILDLPDFQTHRHLYTEFSWTPPAQEHLNPVDQISAIRQRIEAGLMSPQDACESFGDTYEDTLNEIAESVRMRRETEKRYGLPEGSLDALTQTGAKVNEPSPTPKPAAPPIGGQQ